MPFVAAKCPQCGGDLELDNQMETGFCMHCGSKIIVQEAVRRVLIDNSQMIDTWIKLGQAAEDVENYTEAYDYYKKAVENDPNNWKAVFLKGRAACNQSDFGNKRFPELFQGITAAEKIIKDSNLTNDEKTEAYIAFIEAIYRTTVIYANKMVSFINGNPQYVSAIQAYFNETTDCVNNLEYGFNLSSVNYFL